MHARMAAGLESIGKTADGRELVRATCSVQPNEDGTAPSWIQIMPFGPLVKARDGRSFQVTDILKVAASSEMPLLVDWEHQSESFFGSTRAAGWIEQLDVDVDGSKYARPGVWGRVEWTEQGTSDVRSKAFRFLSPVLILDAETLDVESIVSVALTNRPALDMEGISQFRERLSARFGEIRSGAEGEKSMLTKEQLKLLCSALGLGEDVDADKLIGAAKQAFESAATAKTAGQQIVSLSQQLSEKTVEVETLKTRLADADKTAFSAKVAKVLDEASRAGKVTPAMRAGFEQMCSNAAGLQLFEQTILPSLPVIGAAAPGSKAGEGKAEFSVVVDPKVEQRLLKAGYSKEEIAAAQKRLAATAGKVAGSSDDNEED